MTWLMSGRRFTYYLLPFGFVPKGFFFAHVLFLCVLPVFTEPILQLRLGDHQNLTITEKANLRIRKNGTYQGYLYKEARGYYHRTDSLNAGLELKPYEGTIYVLEDLKNSNRQAKRIETTYVGELTADEGALVYSGAPFPRTRNFPTLPDREVAIGERWRDYGEQVVVTRGGADPTRIEFYCEFEYQGISALFGRDVHVITAQYATRYRRGQDPDGDETLTEGSGKHVISIFIDAVGGDWMFIRDQVNEVFRFTDGQTQSSEGFYLTWYEGLIPRNRDADVASIRNRLEVSATEEVDVMPSEMGITVSVKNIHFVPDQAVVLPEERYRLDQIAEALKSIGDRTIKAIGHTADVGTQESQYNLSIDRALVIIEEMVRRGMPAERFIYEGKGGTEPIASNETEEGRSQNRRVEFLILD